MPVATLQNYLNKTNLKESIGSLNVVQGTAKNTGSVYYCIELEFKNGFTKRLFLNDAETFAVSDAFNRLETDDFDED